MEGRGWEGIGRERMGVEWSGTERLFTFMNPIKDGKGMEGKGSDRIGVERSGREGTG